MPSQDCSILVLTPLTARHISFASIFVVDSWQTRKPVLGVLVLVLSRLVSPLLLPSPVSHTSLQPNQTFISTPPVSQREIIGPVEIHFVETYACSSSSSSSSSSSPLSFKLQATKWGAYQTVRVCINDSDVQIYFNHRVMCETMR